jgi:hypothetical protein
VFILKLADEDDKGSFTCPSEWNGKRAISQACRKCYIRYQITEYIRPMEPMEKNPSLAVLTFGLVDLRKVGMQGQYYIHRMGGSDRTCRTDAT